MIVFSIPTYEGFANQTFHDIDTRLMIPSERGRVRRQSFPDGELGLTLLTPVRDKDVVLVGGTHSSDATLEIYDLSCAIAKYGARSLTLLIPYFGCSTMERATEPGGVVTAKTRARLLSAIPQTTAGNRAFLLDLHSEGIPHYFEGNMTATHVYAKPVIMDWVYKYAKTASAHPCVLASTDAGRAKWVESLANDLGLPAAFIIKRRDSGTETKVLAVSADVKGKTVIIYDDMIRSGGSLRGAAEAYREAGAAYVIAVATHGVFTLDAESTMRSLTGSRLFNHITITNSHPNSLHAPRNGITVLDVTSVFEPYFRT